MSCKQCFKNYDNFNHKPYHLECQHTYCITCVKNGINKCPTCDQQFNINNINVNLEIADLIEKNENLFLHKMKIDCKLCENLFDFSQRRPYQLSCTHSICLECINNQFGNKRRIIDTCPICNYKVRYKYENLELLEFIAESEYDKLKLESLNGLTEIKKIKQDLGEKRVKKLKFLQAKLMLIKNGIQDETTRMIEILKGNEKILTNKCNKLIEELNANLLNSSKYEEENLLLFNQITADSNKAAVEKNELDKDELTNFNNEIFEIKQKLNKSIDKIKNYEYVYKFVPNKISNEALTIGVIQNFTIEKVIIIF